MRNLTVEQSIISLVRSALDNSVAEVPSDIDWKNIFKIGISQKLAPLIFRGVSNSGIELPSGLQEKLDKLLLNYFAIDSRQQRAISEISKAFEASQIDYMPVKGILLKQLYPSTDSRPMGDGDILIRMEQKDKAIDVMRSLGYEFDKESAHEFVCVKPGICIELHKCLIPPYNKDYYAYFGDGWQLAEKASDTTLYRMCDDDHFIYMFTHFAKHYRDGGISALHIVDFWIYTQNKSLNFEYIRSELAKLELERFFDNIMNTMRVWFGVAESTEMTDFITARIFDNGAWGTDETKLKADSVKASKSGKNASEKMTLNLVFPSAEKLQYRFPILKKHKYLLPVMWVVRWFDVLLFKRYKIHDRMDEVKNVNEEFVSSYQKELDYVGLDFNFKE